MSSPKNNPTNQGELVTQVRMVAIMIQERPHLLKLSWQPLGPLLKARLLAGPTCKTPRSTQRSCSGIRRSPKMCQVMCCVMLMKTFTKNKKNAPFKGETGPDIRHHETTDFSLTIIVIYCDEVKGTNIVGVLKFQHVTFYGDITDITSLYHQFPSDV